MSDLIACLSMYDWPEIRQETDALWRSLSRAFVDHGVVSSSNVPKALNRESDLKCAWLDNNLLLGQSCGLPFVTSLLGKVELLGSVDYQIDGEEGCYMSLIISRPGMEFEQLINRPGLRFAYNDQTSQSGVAAFTSTILESGQNLPQGFQAVRSYSHRASIQMVADGKADMACIDAVTFGLAKRYEPAVKKVEVIGQTAQTPGLPFIASQQFHGVVPKMQIAIGQALAGLSQDLRNGLLIRGYVERSASDYEGFLHAWQKARSAGILSYFK